MGQQGVISGWRELITSSGDIVYGPHESAIPFSLNSLPFSSQSRAGQTALQQAPAGGGKQHLVDAVISANVPTANPAEE